MRYKQTISINQSVYAKIPFLNLFSKLNVLKMWVTWLERSYTTVFASPCTHATDNKQAARISPNLNTNFFLGHR